MHELQRILERQVRKLASGVLSEPQRASFDGSSEADVRMLGRHERMFSLLERMLSVDDHRAPVSRHGALCSALIAVGLAAMTAACGGSSSRPDEFTGTIAFKGYENRLFTVDAGDSTVTRIGRYSSSGAPTWSPDGATIAYSLSGGDLVIADATGSGARRLRTPWCFEPQFSPDGSRVVCDVVEPNTIAVVDARTGKMLLETDDCCWQPAWSPDGRQLAYVSYGTYDPKRPHAGYVGPSGLFIMNADGSGKRRVAKNVSYDETPVWSSRGDIAFVGDGGIWAVKASGRDLRRLMRADGRDTRGLAWSPNGQKLVFGHGDGDYEVFVVNADGSGLENLTANEKIQDEWPSWSPDGRAIVFTSDRDGGMDQVFAMRSDGSGETQLTDDQRYVWGGICCAVWSPTG